MYHLPKHPSGKIVSSNITALNLNETVFEIERWISFKKNNYVCVCNTHSIVTASNDPYFNEVLNNAGICTPDGMPLVWALRMYGFKGQDRVDGPNLMLKLCELSSKNGYRIYLYGGTQQTLDQLYNQIKSQNSSIKIVGRYSPPFRKLTDNEENEIIQKINASNADLIFVSLGCPKQEVWMYNNRNKVNGIMLGVGAAFDFITGNIKRPPIIIQKFGLEWFYRLISEPKRLWKRYAYNNPMYVYRFFKTYRINKEITRNTNDSLKRRLSS
ncbi:WecB/TagA/CpsF family glycosyltransferase [Paenibacillus tarimensis]